MENKRNINYKWFVLQWHLTAHCDQRCKHCYVSDHRTYENELKNKLEFAECKTIIDSFVSFCKQIKAKPAINFTGGDPLLRPDFYEILKYAHHKNIDSNILGNPFHLNEGNLFRLKRLGVRSYQLSIDGMKQKHDLLRKSGSFNKTINAIKLLKRRTFRTVIMFTLSKYNMPDLKNVMSLVSELGVDAFAFARMTMNSSNKIYFSKSRIRPLEYRDFLLSIEEHIEYLKNKGSKTQFNKKDHLWKLLLYEEGKLKISQKPDGNNQIISGCHIGQNSLSILADGTVFACRRFYSPIGKLPSQSILNIFTSTKLQSYRQLNKFKKCSSCFLLYHCRGCPAVEFSQKGNYFDPDPQCWKN